MQGTDDQLKELRAEIENYYRFLEQKLQRDIYYTVFYSKCCANAKILFIGLNPGYIEEKWTGELQTFEYLEHNYNLASQTRKLFELAGYPSLLRYLDLEDNIVKTNLYYACTIGVRQLNDFIAELRQYNLEQDFLSKSKKWTQQLINIVNPKLIIYEGITVFNESPPFIEGLTIKDENKVEGKTSAAYFYNELNCGLYYYSRRWSNIRDIEEAAIILNFALNKI